VNYSVSDFPTLPAVHRTQLSNGVVVLVTENPTADIVAARLFLRAGSCLELPHHAGLAHLLSSVLTKGTDRYSSLDIAEQVESVGASLGTDATTDYFSMSIKTVSADFEAILKLAAELLRSPTFPQHELELEQRLTVQAIRSQQEQPFSVAYDQLRHMMYGDHPYALPGLGTEETMMSLTRADLVAFHQAHFRPDNLVISICGRIGHQQAVDLVKAVFGDWQVSQVAPMLPTLPAVTHRPVRQAIAQDTQQSIIMLGYLSPGIGTGSTDPTYQDYVALKLLSTHLGNGLSSRLFVELREKRGLAYDVSAFYTTRLGPAQFVAYIGTAPDNTAIALEGLQTEVDRLRTTPFTEDELQAAKNKLLGQYALGKQTNAQIAQIYGWYEILNVGIDFDVSFQAKVAETSADTAQAIACKVLASPSVSLVGPASAVKPLV
jgi:predicted Zn-dependent peptidase